VNIRVSGRDANGIGFLTPSKALVLSRHGAEIFLTQALAPEQEITLQHPGMSKDGKARVVGLFTRKQNGFTYGIEFLDEEINFWETEFPPARYPDSP
jgi:hypothetical protein